jgi:hypothetical protein
MPKADSFPTPDAAGDLFLGPVIQGRKSFLLKSREIIYSLESSGHEFWQFDHEGKVLNYWRPRFDCDCEYGLRTEYELRDFTLLKFFGKTNDSRVDDSWHWTVEVILNVDRRLDVDSPEAPAFWRAVARNRTC